MVFWPTAWWILDWLRELPEGLSSRQSELIDSLNQWAGREQYRITSRSSGDAEYWGRYFSEAAYLMENEDKRRMTREEALRRLTTDDYGWFWWSGVDTGFIDSITAKDLGALLSYHQAYRQGPKAKSGVLIEYLVPDRPMREAARRDIELALRSNDW